MKPTLFNGIAPIILCSAILCSAGPTTNPADLERDAFKQIRQIAENLLAEAAKLPLATWPEVKTEEDLTFMPTTDARLAATVWWLQSRYDFSQGRFAEFADDLMNAMALGRHIAQQRLILSSLITLGIEVPTIDRFAESLPSLPRDVLGALPQRLAALPAAPSLAEVLTEDLRVMKPLMAARFEKEPKLSAEDKAALLKNMAAGAEAIEKAAGPAADLAPDDFVKTLKAAADKANDPSMQVLIPSLAAWQDHCAILRSKRAMLDAAIKIQAGGDPKQSHDPYGNGPFAYQTNAKGFTLHAALQRTRPTTEPVVLRVGRPD
jgi:hypothetical protein